MKTVKCPTCGKPAVFAPENRYRPFCSERCATLDLGAWAEEKYSVPAFDQDSKPVNQNTDDESSSSENLPPKHQRN